MDLISRQAAIDAVSSNCGICIQKIVDLPTADLPHWIPVTEALPHTDDKVLCCTMTKKGVPGIVIGYYLRGEHGCSWACGMNNNVIAWMPLPDPYEAET